MGMVAFPLAQRLILPIASAAGGLAATIAGIAMLGIPAESLEGAVMASGLPAILAAAEPPLGWTARAGLAAVLGALLGGPVWLGLRAALGARTITVPLFPGRASASTGEPLTISAPILRRADAHPDAPPRRPLMAEELGTPFLEVTAPKLKLAPVEQPLPVDLSTPLAAVDPDAIPELPVQPVRAVPSLYRKPEPIQAPGERFEAFELPRIPLTAMTQDIEPMLGPRTEATVHALLERLERGVAQRARPVKRAGLQDTLAELRMLARG
jgi:hypothetical protein